MITINGKVLSGRDAVIVNGQIINNGGIGKRQRFDERKTVDCSNIDKITIDTIFGDINMSVSNSSKLEAHLHGEADIEGDVKFEVVSVNRELRITLKISGNCFNKDLRLDVSVPQKTFKLISVKSSTANITLNEGISTDNLKVKTSSGDLVTNATVINVSVSTMSGDVDIFIDANQDLNVDVSTMNGDVSLEFNNIGHIDLSTNSMNGNVRNHHKESRGYNAYVDISTMNGDVRIR